VSLRARCGDLAAPPDIPRSEIAPPAAYHRRMTRIRTSAAPRTIDVLAVGAGLASPAVPAHQALSGTFDRFPQNDQRRSNGAGRAAPWPRPADSDLTAGPRKHTKWTNDFSFTGRNEKDRKNDQSR